jgi:putative ABC transport system substrate-binding protein
VQVADPVTQGFVQNVRQPGGMITGFSLLEFSLAGKWIDLLKQAAPGLRRVAFMFDADDPLSKFFVPAAETAAPAIGVEVIAPPVRSASDIESAMARLAGPPDGGVVVPAPEAVHRDLIIKLASQYRLPAIYSDRVFVTARGLISYLPDRVHQFRSAAGYVDRILKGEKPGDLPVQAPTKYELVINLKTAKALGLTMPPALLASADEVIE